MLGSGEKRVLPVEEDVVPNVRRGIAAAVDLPAGHVVQDSDLVWLRPAGPLRPGDEAAVVGRRLLRSVSRGEHLGPSDLGGA
jgi:N,N'-diacetyllegionaminate synthase